VAAGLKGSPSTYAGWSENALSHEIIGCAIEVHRTLGGPGLLESVYEEALAWEMEGRGLNVQRQVLLPIQYKGHLLGTPLRIDLLVEGKVIVECKSVNEYNDLFEAQTLTYLRLSGKKLALIINFGDHTIKDGVHRVVNGL
jgi:GxxExxY protein